MVDVAFVGAEWFYHLGDSRPLAEYVRAHNLTPEQREYVARVLLGEGPKGDGRKHKPQTEAMVLFYDSFKRHQAYLYPYLDDAKIYKMLDEKYRLEYGTSRRAISRAKKRNPAA